MSRSLKLLRDAGYQATVVEQWVPRAKVRRDAFGFADILAFNSEQQITLLVQTTTATNVSHRKNKITKTEELNARLIGWLECGNAFHIHGWVKRGRFWQCNVTSAEFSGGLLWEKGDTDIEKASFGT